MHASFMPPQWRHDEAATGRNDVELAARAGKMPHRMTPSPAGG
jgi:hypothetical protein